MRVDHTKFIKYAWILLAITVFRLFLGSHLNNEDSWFAAEMSMSYGMLILSFPSGLLYFMLAGLIFDSIHFYTPASYFLIWFGTFIVGYLQWFWLIPYLSRQKEITKLGITQGAPINITSTTSTNQRQVCIRTLEQSADIDASPILQFDENGCTPLERVINKK